MIDEETGQPVALATLDLNGEQYTTNDKGEYTVKLVPGETYPIGVTAANYKPERFFSM